MNRKLFLSIILGLFFLTGCAAQNQMYYYGDYSRTLYAMNKNLGEESMNKHILDLETIIKESKSRNLPVPPGIYAELGYWYLKQNRTEEAELMFEEEEKLYPESKTLMDRLINKAHLEEKASAQDGPSKKNKDSKQDES